MYVCVCVCVYIYIMNMIKHVGAMTPFSYHTHDTTWYCYDNMRLALGTKGRNTKIPSTREARASVSLRGCCCCTAAAPLRVCRLRLDVRLRLRLHLRVLVRA